MTLLLDASVTIRSEYLTQLEADLRQVLKNLGVDGVIRIERGQAKGR